MKNLIGVGYLRIFVAWMLGVCMLVAGCQGKAEKVATSSNGEWKVERLFEMTDGPVKARVYRFGHNGESNYFVMTEGGGGSAKWTTSDGKTTTDHIIVTVPAEGGGK